MMEYKNKLSRYIFYIKKKSAITLSEIKGGRFLKPPSGPKILLNSLPKSGTHLIESLFLQLPQIRHYGGRTIMINNHDDSFKKGLDKLRSVKKGQFAPSHIQFNENILKEILLQNFKIIQMIRDPRDVLISNLLYVRDLDKTHKAHNFIKNQDKEIDQFKAVLTGKENIIEPFKDVVNKFSGWVSNAEVLTIKFEELVGASGGGSNEVQLSAINRILNYVDIDVPELDRIELAKKVFSTKSSTFNTGQIGKWKKIFTEEHKRICKDNLQRILENLGYENDASW